MTDTTSSHEVSEAIMDIAAEKSNDEKLVSEVNPISDSSGKESDDHAANEAIEDDNDADEGSLGAGEGEEKSTTNEFSDESQSSASEDENEDESEDDDDSDQDENKNSDGLSEYERLRLLRIKRNQARLEELGLVDNKPKPTPKKGPRKSTGRPKADGPAREQPKREVKNRLSREQLHGGLDVRKLRLPSDDSTNHDTTSKKKQKKNKSSNRCGECSGCLREADCNTCIYCVERINGDLSKSRRCLFKSCLTKYRKNGKQNLAKIVVAGSPDNTNNTNDNNNKNNNDENEHNDDDNNNKDNQKEDTHYECDICKGSGDLIVCGGCQRSFHSNCHFPKIKRIPEEDWLCMECNPRSRLGGLLLAVLPNEKKVTKVKVLEPAPKCKVCDGDCRHPVPSTELEFIQCKACDAHFHLGCHDPPMDEKPRGGALRWWKCAVCKEANNPILEHHQSSAHTPKTSSTNTPRIPKKANLKLFEGEHDDDCYICYNGGELVCCDFCPKVFHCACHIPALPAIPQGIWKCCECYASERKRKTRCGECKACLAPDCGKCHYCLDMPKFGGNHKLKKPCVNRECQYQSYAETFIPGKIPGEITQGSSSKATTRSTKPPPNPNIEPKKEKKRKRESEVSKGSPRRKNKDVKIEEADVKSSSPRRKNKRVKIEEQEMQADVKSSSPRHESKRVKIEEKEMEADVKRTRTSPRRKSQRVKIEEHEMEGAAEGEHEVEEMVDENGEVAKESTDDDDNDEEPIVVKIKVPKMMDPVSVKVRKIISGAYREPDDSKVQDKACEHIRKFTTKRNLNKIILAGGIEMISQAMSRHPDKTICQAEACCTIAGMAWVEPTIGTKLAHVGVIKQIVSCMDRFPNNLKCQQMGLGAFRALSYDDSNFQFINEANGLSAALASMVRNPKKLVVQKEGCSFLQNLLVESADTIAKQIVEAEVIPVILDALSNESADTEFKESVLGLVKNLALYDNAKASICKSSAIATLVSTVQTSTEVEIRQASCSILNRIATKNPSNRTRIAEAGGVSAILCAVKTFPKEPDINVAAFELLKELAVEDEDIAATIVEDGGLAVILSAMKGHSDLARVQVAACDVIAFLPFGNGNKIAPKIAEAIVLALENHPKAANVQAIGCEALLEIVTHVQAVRKLVQKRKTRQLLAAAKERNKDCESDVDDILAS